MAKVGGLTEKQERFCKEYVIDFNGTQAATRAGYSEKTAQQIASENLLKPLIIENIQAEIKRLNEATGITAERVREELGRLAFSNMDDFATWGPDGVDLLDSEDLPEDAARCVSEVSQTTTKEGGSIRFKLHDKTKALDLLGRHFSMFTDKVEHLGSVEVGIREIRYRNPEEESS